MYFYANTILSFQLCTLVIYFQQWISLAALILPPLLKYTARVMMAAVTLNGDDITNATTTTMSFPENYYNMEN